MLMFFTFVFVLILLIVCLGRFSSLNQEIQVLSKRYKVLSSKIDKVQHDINSLVNRQVDQPSSVDRPGGQTNEQSEVGPDSQNNEASGGQHLEHDQSYQHDNKYSATQSEPDLISETYSYARRHYAQTSVPADSESVGGSRSKSKSDHIPKTDQFFKASSRDSQSTQTTSAYLSNKKPDQAPTQNERSGVIKSVWNFLVRGNIMAKIGVLILFIGMAFLLRYAFQQIHITVTEGLVAVDLSGLIMLALGVYLVPKNRIFANTLMGGGFGLFYMCNYAAFRYFQILPAEIALILMLVISLAIAFIAWRINAYSLMLMSGLGGYLSPLLLHYGIGSPGGLLSYYWILSFASLLVTFFKPWRSLPWLSLVMTASYATCYKLLAYQPDDFAILQLFLLLNWLTFSGLTLLAEYYNLKGSQPPNIAKRACSLILLTAISSLVFQTWLILPNTNALSLIYLGYALAYAVPVVFCSYYRVASNLLWTALLLSLSLVTLAILAAFSIHSVILLWLIEATILISLGIKQEQNWLVYLGIGLKTTIVIIMMDSALLPFISLDLLAPLYGLSICVFWISFMLHYHARPAWLVRLFEPIVYLGLLSWLLAGYDWLLVRQYFEGTHAWWWFGLYYMLTAAVIWGLYERYKLAFCYKVNLATLPGLFLLSVIGFFEQTSTYSMPFSYWCLLIAIWLVIFYRFEKLVKTMAAWHWGTFILLTLGVYHLMYVHITPYIDLGLCSPFWLLAGFYGWLLISLMTIDVIYRRQVWPARSHLAQYKLIMLALVHIIAYSIILFNFDFHAPDPMIYRWWLDPIWLLTLITGGCLGWNQDIWAKQYNTVGDLPVRLPTLFLWGGLLVAYHLWIWRAMTLEYQMPAKLAFVTSQTQLLYSLSWAVLGGVLTYLSRRFYSAYMWWAGCVLLLATAVKMLLFDLSMLSTLAKVIMFISVGIIFLIVGYLAPLPTRSKKNGDTS